MEYKQHNGEISMNAGYPGLTRTTKMADGVDNKSQILVRIEEKVALIPELHAKCNEMHDVLYQLLRNVERISEHLSLQPPVARVTPQTGAGALNASATLQTLGLKKGEMPKGLSQSMKSMSFPFNAQEDLDLTEDKVEINRVRPITSEPRVTSKPQVTSEPYTHHPEISQVLSDDDDDDYDVEDDDDEVALNFSDSISQRTQSRGKGEQRDESERLQDDLDLTDLKTEKKESPKQKTSLVNPTIEDADLMGGVLPSEMTPQKVAPQNVQASPVMAQKDMELEENTPVEAATQGEVDEDLPVSKSMSGDSTPEVDGHKEIDQVNTITEEEGIQFSRLKCKRTVKSDDNRIALVYSKDKGMERSGPNRQNVKDTNREVKRENHPDSDEETTSNVRFVPISSAGASQSFNSSTQKSSDYQNFQNSNLLSAQGGSLKSSLKPSTTASSEPAEPDNRPDGGSNLKILSESELEELTLKEANRAADCTDHKSQGADTIICIDSSASMQGQKIEQIREFIESFLEGIEDVAVENSLEENIAVVTFGNETRVIQNLTNDYSKIRDSVETLEANGPSPIMTGLVLCMSAIYNRGGVVTFRERKIYPRIILLTDGGVTDQRIFNGPDTIVKQGGTKKEVWHKLMEFAERFRTHSDPRNLVCVPIGDDADMTLLGQLVNTAGGTIVQPGDVKKLSHHFLINTVVAKIIHDGALRGPDLSDDELKQKIKATEGGTDFEESEMEEALMMIKKDKEIRAQGGATGGADGSTIETKEMPPIGSRVRRGPDWRWDNQDDNLPGTVVAHKSRGYLTVEWDTGNRGKYRYGAESGAKDVRMVDEPRMLPPGMMVAVGVRARRGQDWEWGSQDGGEGSSGVIFKVEDSGIVHVRWDNGKRGNYRFGLFGKYDVEVCPQCVVTEGATGLSDGGSLRESSELKGLWQWQDKEGRWRDHAVETSDKIENLYQTRHGKGTVVVESENEKYRVIPEKKCQRNVSTGTEVPIRRIEVTMT
ncbi:uncharacterized protein LOC111130362 isoform X1 [Crassostrea virginica]